jgi:ATP-dependent RNA helicase SUPV3L1/SUV3
VRLFGELGPEPARERAARRLEAWLASERVRRLPTLHRLESAIEEGRPTGLARGVAYQLVESGGVLDRRLVALELKSLSRVERRALKALGVRFGAHSLWIPDVERPRARTLASALAEPEAPGFRAPHDRISEITGEPTPRALAARGLRALGALAVPASAVEKMDELMRAGANGPAWPLTDEMRAALGWGEAEAQAILKALGFTRAKKPEPGAVAAWRPPRLAAPPRPAGRQAHSPFAALAALKPEPPQRHPQRRRPPKRRARSA